jgi:hypothetical protein
VTTTQANISPLATAQMPTFSQSALVQVVQPDTPFRLSAAVAFFFPGGGMTVSGLRREIARGRLEYELIAGKQFVTPAGMQRMRALCRIPAQHNAAQNGSMRRHHGLSSPAAAISSQQALEARLNSLSKQAPRPTPAESPRQRALLK